MPSVVVADMPALITEKARAPSSVQNLLELARQGFRAAELGRRLSQAEDADGAVPCEREPVPALLAGEVEHACQTESRLEQGVREQDTEHEQGELLPDGGCGHVR